MKGGGKKPIEADYIGTRGADSFIYHFDGSDKTVSNFDYWGGDKLVLDSGAGVYSGIMGFGRLEDGRVLTNHLDTASFLISSGDFNSDGKIDTKITCDIADGSLILLGITPSDIAASAILGG
jgi:hypothetical protein